MLLGIKQPRPLQLLIRQVKPIEGLRRLIIVPVHFRTMSTVTPNASGKTVAQYGTWKSPITADILTQKSVAFGEVAVIECHESTADIAFVENRPQEGGRAAIISKTVDLKTLEIKDKVDDLTKGNFNARSGVHEYGGGALATSGKGDVIFTDYKSFNVYEVIGDGEPKKLTPENKAHRFADFAAHPVYPFVVCVLEDHTNDRPEQVINTLVTVNKEDSTVQTLVSGSDFYSSPRISPDGRFIAWVSWNHPSMPFFATQLWLAELKVDADGKTVKIDKEKLIGTLGADEVSHHPVWTGDSTLVFSNDRTGFANLYKILVEEGVKTSAPKALCRDPVESEFIGPAWVLNNSYFAVLSNGWLACSMVTKALTSFVLLHTESGEMRSLKTPFVAIDQLRALGPTTVIFNGVQSNEPSAIVVMDLSESIKDSNHSPRWQIVKRSSSVVEQGIVPREYLTKAQVIEFPTELPDGTDTTAHAVIFPPCNPKYIAPAGSSPPCIVKIHGGPTSNVNSGLNLALNYWTSRGYMVCMVNYGGSTGYGREYMLRLEGQWGVVDVRDAVAAATYLGSPDSGSSQKQGQAKRRINQKSQEEMQRLKEKRLASGAVDFSLEKPGSWSIDIGDALLAATLTAAGALIPGLEAHHGLTAATLAWLYRKLTHVQQESVLAIPTVGLQLTTVRGFTLPSFGISKKSKEERFYTTSKQTKLIPRDCILDIITNEAFRRWGVVDYLAVAVRSPPASKSASRGDRLDVLFPNMLPRLPVVEYVYRSIYPTIFDHDVPVKLSSSSQESAADVEKGDDLDRPLSGPLADPTKIAISGGSAGGFTVLASLCLYPRAFSAGCSSYGVSDIAALDAESHKFESRYTERLMGGSPAQVPEIYKKRSPINMANRISSPVLLLQGDIDKVVPPEQSESIYKIMQENGTKTKYILFEGEGHGFRMAANIKRALEEEEAWYRSCFNIKAIDD